MGISDNIETIFNKAFDSMPHEFSSKIFAKKTRELGLPKTSHVKNMRTEYLKKKTIRLNRFVYYKGGFEHTIKYKVTNTPENKEFYDAIRFCNIDGLKLMANGVQISSVDYIVNTIKNFTLEEKKLMANKLGWKVQVKVETWNEL